MGSSLYQMVLLAVRLVADTIKWIISGEVLLVFCWRSLYPTSILMCWGVGGLYMQLSIFYESRCSNIFSGTAWMGCWRIYPETVVWKYISLVLLHAYDCVNVEMILPSLLDVHRRSPSSIMTCFIQISLMYLVMSTLLIHPFSLAVTRKPGRTLSFGSVFLLNITIKSPLAVHDNNNFLPILIFFPPILFNILFAIKLQYISV